MIKIAFHYLTVFCFIVVNVLYPNISWADERVVTLQEGDSAPFSGTLFSTEAAARVLVDLELANESCEIQVERQVENLRAEMLLDYRNLEASRDALQLRYDQTLQIKNDQIDFLQQQARPKMSREVTLIVGVLTGVGLTIASAYTLDKINSP
mgnify:CR=1 FL=1